MFDMSGHESRTADMRNEPLGADNRLDLRLGGPPQPSSPVQSFEYITSSRGMKGLKESFLAVWEKLASGGRKRVGDLTSVATFPSCSISDTAFIFFACAFRRFLLRARTIATVARVPNKIKAPAIAMATIAAKGSAKPTALFALIPPFI
jgi:hypothetical protein